MKRDLEISKKAMAWTNLSPFSERPMDELSGGERKGSSSPGSGSGTGGHSSG